MADRKTWAKRVAAWRASGLTARAYAEREEVSERTLRYWAWRLKRKARPAELVRVVRAAGVEPVEAMPSPLPRTDVVLVVGNARVRVQVDLDRETLARVFEVLAAAIAGLAPSDGRPA
jgi:hypothetical protein